MTAYLEFDDVLNCENCTNEIIQTFAAILQEQFKNIHLSLISVTENTAYLVITTDQSDTIVSILRDEDTFVESFNHELLTNYECSLVSIDQVQISYTGIVIYFCCFFFFEIYKVFFLYQQFF